MRKLIFCFGKKDIVAAAEEFGVTGDYELVTAITFRQNIRAFSEGKIRNLIIPDSSYTTGWNVCGEDIEILMSKLATKEYTYAAKRQAFGRVRPTRRVEQDAISYDFNCPFCGERPVLSRSETKGRFFVECVNDLCSIRPRTRSYSLSFEARSAWNKRKSSPSLLDELCKDLNVAGP